MPLLLAAVVVLIPLAVLAAIALAHHRQGAELESSMRWFASAEGESISRAGTRDVRRPMAA